MTYQQKLAISILLAAASMPITLLASRPAHAQDATSGEVFGGVKDDVGNPLVGIDVMLVDASHGFRATSTTGRNGTFRFPRVANADYVISIGTAAGQRVERNVHVTAGTVQTFDFGVAHGENGTADTITVNERIATSTSKNHLSAETGLNIDVDALYSRVPVRRDISSAAMLAPGVTAADR